MSRRFRYIIIATITVLIVAGAVIGLTRLTGAFAQPARKQPPTPTKAVSVPATGSSQQMTTTENQFAQQLLVQINQDRATQGLPAYALDAKLTQSAMAHNHVMADTDCGLNHVCPNEPNPGKRMSNAGANWNTWGENIGYAAPANWDGVMRIHTGMMGETPPDDGHRRILLSSAFHRIGIGILIDAKGRIWVTEDFTN